MTKTLEKCLDRMDEIRMDLIEIHSKICDIEKEMVEASKLPARERNVTRSILNVQLSRYFLVIIYFYYTILVLIVDIVFF